MALTMADLLLTDSDETRGRVDRARASIELASWLSAQAVAYAVMFRRRRAVIAT